MGRTCLSMARTANRRLRDLRGGALFLIKLLIFKPALLSFWPICDKIGLQVILGLKETPMGIARRFASWLAGILFSLACKLEGMPRSLYNELQELPPGSVVKIAPREDTTGTGETIEELICNTPSGLLSVTRFTPVQPWCDPLQDPANPTPTVYPWFRIAQGVDDAAIYVGSGLIVAGLYDRIAQKARQLEPA